jgi:predicted N-acyltransferase
MGGASVLTWMQRITSLSTTRSFMLEPVESRDHRARIESGWKPQHSILSDQSGRTRAAYTCLDVGKS